MADLVSIKNRFGIIGNFSSLNRAIEKAIQVAPTDISVLVIGESGVGKEHIPKIIHSESRRKHQPYIVVNCGAIPEGTIDSELFGHEKGAFTGATSTRKGYFEVADRGTIFLDEVGELPLQTQVRLLRVLESGEFMKVGSSQVQKTDVRIVAATNVNMMKAIRDGRFREDLYYRLNTVQIDMPPLRERKGDIHLLFRKFAIDFAEKYRMPELQLTPDGIQYLERYHFPGNVRQLRNLVEQLTVVETHRQIDAQKLSQYIPLENTLPAVVSGTGGTTGTADFREGEREMIYKFIFELKKEVDDLKEILKLRSTGFSGHEQEVFNPIYSPGSRENALNPNRFLPDTPKTPSALPVGGYVPAASFEPEVEDVDVLETKDVSLSLVSNEKDLIIKALEKHKGRRNRAADELGISQRTLYRKIKQYNLED